MGLFSQWTKKEGTGPETPPEAPKPEGKETKGTAETGRERVAAIGKGIRDKWNNWSPKVLNAGKWLLDGAASLGFGIVGGAEKGLKATGRGIESGYKATAKYGSETTAEGGQLIDTGVDKLKMWAGEKARQYDTARLNAKVGLNEKVDSMNTWAQKRAEDYEAGKEFAGVAFDVGIGAINGWAQKKVDQFNAFKKNAENVPADAKREWERVKAEVLGAISENYAKTRDGAKSDYAKARTDVSAAKDRFSGWFNQKRAELSGTAELKGEVQALREQVERQNRLIEALVILQEARAEKPRISMPEAGKATEPGV